jgi:hypothetical protein
VSSPPVTAAGSASAAPALITALSAAADAENAAIYGYSVAGARLTSARERAVARGHYDVHRAQLQAVTGWLADRGAAATPPAAMYVLPGHVGDDVSASALLTQLEEATAARYADLIAVATGSLQRAAALALQAAAVREAHWRGRSVPYPGLFGRLPS